MNLPQILTLPIQKAVRQLFDVSIDRVEFQITRKEFEGDITMVIFPLLKVIKGNPIDIGTKIGNYLVENVDEIIRFNVVSGFLNIVVSDNYYLTFFNEIKNKKNIKNKTKNIKSKNKSNQPEPKQTQKANNQNKRNKTKKQIKFKKNILPNSLLVGI